MGLNRRTFIRCITCRSGQCRGVAAVRRAERARAIDVPGYKALVCVFLFGGNDANNTLVQFDTAGYNNYSTVRGPLAIPQNQLLQLERQLPDFA